MKLHCKVEVHNRAISINSTRRKAVRSVVAIGRQSVKSTELHILLQTLENKEGTKYKIDENIETIFVKFINDGKATIRLKEPAHDLIIKADPVQLKSFMHILKLGVSKKINPSILSISNLKPKSISTLPKTKVVIHKISEYPTLEGFPKTTQELHIIGLSRKSFDRQILRLQSLKILNLSKNNISMLPKELGSLPNLQELIVCQNQLGKASAAKWAWLDQSAIKKSLRLLDVSGNLLTELPNQLGKLDILVNLKANQNQLTYVPHSIGNLPNLKYIDLSKNCLIHLPGSMKNLSLMSIDVSDNVFLGAEPSVICKNGVPSLVECAARTFLKLRFSYDATTIPYTLVKHLDLAKYCVCGNACIDCYIKKVMQWNLNTIANTVKSSGDVVVPFDCYFCSASCAQRYAKIEF